MRKAIWPILLLVFLSACGEAGTAVPAVQPTPGPRIVDDDSRPLDAGQITVDVDSPEYRGLTHEEVLRRIGEEVVAKGLESALDEAPGHEATIIQMMVYSSSPEARKQGIERLVTADDETVEWVLRGARIGPELPADEALLLLTAIARPNLRGPRPVTDGLAAAPSATVRIRTTELFATVEPPDSAHDELAKMLEVESDEAVKEAILDAMKVVERRR